MCVGTVRTGCSAPSCTITTPGVVFFTAAMRLPCREALRARLREPSKGPTRPWSLAFFPQHSERLHGLSSDDYGEAIADFQESVGGWDDLIAVAVYGNQHTPDWQPQFVHLLAIKARA